MSEEQYFTIFGHQIKHSDAVKVIGLVAFIVLSVGIVAALWPSLRLVFEPDGLDKLIESIQSKGAFGVLMLLGLQLLQIIVAFIPGEVVQVAAGMLYGPVWGTIITLIGCVFSSAIIYELVHRLGAPFVHSMVDEKYLVKFYEFERSGKLSLTVFILFLIPGMPKDVFTYLVPLTNMRMRTFLTLSTIGRVPGVIMSTYAAAGLADGDIKTSLIIFGIAAILVVLGIVFRNRLLGMATSKKKERATREEFLSHQAAKDADASTLADAEVDENEAPREGATSSQDDAPADGAAAAAVPAQGDAPARDAVAVDKPAQNDRR